MLRHFWIWPYALEDNYIATIVSNVQNLVLNEMEYKISLN